MLISFIFENWLSFKEKTEFTMVASREKQHKDRLAYAKKYDLKILPTVALYGGNASGKTNFFDAFQIAKKFIVQGTQPGSSILMSPFSLDPRSSISPTTFSFTILIGNTIYEYGFIADQEVVHEEWLNEIMTKSEKVLFKRDKTGFQIGEKVKEKQKIELAFENTRENQLFLTNSVYLNIDAFKPVYNWFKYKLKLITPKTKFDPVEHFMKESSPLGDAVNDTLARLDTGITRLGGEIVDFDSLPFSESAKQQIKEDIKDDSVVLRININETGDRYIVTRDQAGALVAKKLVSYHRNSEGKEIPFKMDMESDGTLRIIDLLPAFFEISQPDTSKVYIIDELDRSLHTLLTRQILEIFLQHCGPETRSQLLFTTHDLLLMDQDIFRRDEMWIAERDRNGVSELISFSDYKDIRKDKDVRKSYMQGRLGGIPRLILNDFLLSKSGDGE